MSDVRPRDVRPDDGDADRWWSDLDAAVLGCLARHGACSPTDIARHVGLPEAATVSLLCLLAQEGRITIRLVERCHVVDVRSQVA